MIRQYVYERNARCTYANGLSSSRARVIIVCVDIIFTVPAKARLGISAFLRMRRRVVWDGAGRPVITGDEYGGELLNETHTVRRDRG